MKKKIIIILMFVVILFSMTGCGGVKIKKLDNKSIVYEEFNNGLVKLKVPKGWKVDVLGDYIHYTVKAYNPNNPTYQFFFNLKTEGYNKSEAAKAWQKKFYPNDIFAKASVISTKNTEGFYKIFNELGTLNNTSTFTFPTLTDFTVVDNLGKGLVGGDVLRATFKDKDGNDAEGLFSAYVYDTMFITAPKDEFINYQDVLNTVASSLEFSETFLNGFNKEQDAVMKNFQNIRSICNQITDGIMDSWEKRSTSYDIMSQKQSDATLGYERVYDTKTGEVYKAYNGFTDYYDGKRYKAVTDDMYTKGISGYIEK